MVGVTLIFFLPKFIQCSFLHILTVKEYISCSIFCSLGIKIEGKICVSGLRGHYFMTNFPTEFMDIKEVWKWTSSPKWVAYILFTHDYVSI